MKSLRTTYALSSFIALSTVLGLSVGARAPHQDNSDPERFRGVEEWQMVVTWKAAPKRHEVKEGNVTQVWELQEYSGSLTCRLVKNDNHSAIHYGYISTGEGQTGEVIHKGRTTVTTEDEEGKKSEMITSIVSSGIADFAANLDIDPKAGNFWILSSANSDKGTTSVKAPGANEVKVETPVVVNYPLFGLHEAKKIALPRFGLALSGSDSYKMAIFPFDGSRPELSEVDVHFTWELKPWGTENGQVKLEKLDEKWVPDDGNQVPVRLSVTKGSMTEVRFFLYDVSNLKGTNANTGNGTSPDLELDPNSGYAITQPKAGEWKAENAAPTEKNAVMGVVSHDTAASGKIRAEAKINGKWVKATVDGGGEYLSIPVDKNKNEIADGWEEDAGIKDKNYPATWDEEEVPNSNNSHKGDGIVLFDEYRGINERSGNYKRLSPARQELFVANSLGDKAVPGFQKLSQAARIEVIDLKPLNVQARRNPQTGERSITGDSQNPEKKRVITNKSKHSRNQMLVVLAVGTISVPGEPPTVGITLPEGTFKNGPHDTDGLIVDSALVNTTDPGLILSLHSTIAHELGHAMALRHHGDREPGQREFHCDPVRVGTGNPPQYDETLPIFAYSIKGFDLRFYDKGGTKLATPRRWVIRWDSPGTPNGRNEFVGVNEGPMSGDLSCIMAYQDYYDWFWERGAPGKPEAFFEVPAIPQPDKFCTSRKGTGINADGKYFGDAAQGRGNCVSKFNIKGPN